MRGKLTERLSRPGINFKRLPLPAWLAVAVLTVVILAAVFAPLLTPYDILTQEDAGGGPSGAHWFGMDSANRDIFTRLIYGARWSLIIGLGATALALVAGAVIGAVAATSRKAVDETLMRLLDVVMAFPGIA